MGIPTADTEVSARAQARTTADIFRDIGRAAAQGATLGFSDELYGLYSEFMTDKDYDTAVAEIRQGLEQFRESDPVLAYGAEILGSMVTGGAGATRAVAGTAGREALKRAAAASGVEAGIYGAGTGETMEERALQAAISAPVGAVTGAAGEFALPRLTSAARGLMGRKTAEGGYRLTPGQQFGGGVQKFEGRLTSLPFTGELVGSALGKPVRTFRRDVVETALGPSLAARLPKGLEGNELVEAASLIVADAYKQIVPKISIDDTPFRNKAKRILGAATKRLQPEDITAVQAIMRDIYLPSVKDGKISTNLLKDLESALGTEANTMIRSSDPAFRRQGKVLKEMQAALREEISLQNPDVPDLQAVNQAFAAMRPLEKAKDAAVGAEGMFTPTQLLSKLKDKPAEAPVKSVGRQVQPIISTTTPTSGTIERGLVSQFVRDPFGSAVGGTGLLPLSLMYGTGPLGRRVVGPGVYKAPGGLLRAGAPAVGEMVADPFSESILGPVVP